MKKIYFVYLALIIGGVIGLIFYKADFIFPSESGIMINIYVGILQTGLMGFIFDYINLSNNKREIKKKRDSFLKPIVNKITSFNSMLRHDYDIIAEIVRLKIGQELSKWESVNSPIFYYDKLFLVLESYKEQLSQEVLPFFQNHERILSDILLQIKKVVKDETAKMLFVFNDILNSDEVTLFGDYASAIEIYLDCLETSVLGMDTKNNFLTMLTIANAIVSK